MSDHDGLDAFAALSDEDKVRLQRYHNGAKFSGAARNKLLDFATEQGWSEDTLNDVLRLLAHTPT
jgi:hypothetical protein